MQNEENRENGFTQNCGNITSQILDMLFLELFWCTDQKNFGGGSGGTPRFAPRQQGPQNDVFAHFGGKKIRNSKFFFLQICLFLGPIDAISNIFSPGLPFWLNSKS